MGIRSLTVVQMVHLNTFKSLGHRTREPHVMQFPVAKSLLPAGPPLLWVFAVCRDMAVSSSVKSRSGGGPVLESCLFFLPLNNEGKGWLIEREWPGWRGLGLGLGGWNSESESLESVFTRAKSRPLPSRRPGSLVGVSRAELWMRLMRSLAVLLGWESRRLLQGAIAMRLGGQPSFGAYR